ncbi:hypothetical protein GCM10027284_01960 [Cyclobacterium sediminis]
MPDKDEPQKLEICSSFTSVHARISFFILIYDSHGKQNQLITSTITKAHFDIGWCYGYHDSKVWA